MLIEKEIEKAPIIMQANSFCSLARNVTNRTDPISAIFSATKMIVSACVPPNDKYPVKCLILGL